MYEVNAKVVELTSRHKTQVSVILPMLKIFNW